MNATLDIHSVTPAEFEENVDELAKLMQACVHAGASINFIMPFPIDESLDFWRRKVQPALNDGIRVLLVARHEGKIAGSVQLDCDTPPNQPHRAEITKLMVHPDLRRRGVARTLMHEVEAIALQRGRNLITLDTRTGDSAEPLYASLGYKTAGIIPGYCRDTHEERLEATTIMHKDL